MPKVVKISRAAIPHVEFVKGMKTYISVLRADRGEREPDDGRLLPRCRHG